MIPANLLRHTAVIERRAVTGAGTVYTALDPQRCLANGIDTFRHGLPASEQPSWTVVFLDGADVTPGDKITVTTSQDVTVTGTVVSIKRPIDSMGIHISHLEVAVA